MDLELVENGNGGDFVKTTKDLSVINGFENFPYLALFGGNTEASTPANRLPSEQDFSWWGNGLMPNDSSIQINSLTERRLLEVALNSAGRLKIEEAIKKDLDFMKPFANVTVATFIIATDRLLISLSIIRPDNLEQKTFQYIWDSTMKELIIRGTENKTNGVVFPESTKIFDFSFDDSFE